MGVSTRLEGDESVTVKAREQVESKNEFEGK